MDIPQLQASTVPPILNQPLDSRHTTTLVPTLIKMDDPIQHKILNSGIQLWQAATNTRNEDCQLWQSIYFVTTNIFRRKELSHKCPTLKHFFLLQLLLSKSHFLTRVRTEGLKHFPILFCFKNFSCMNPLQCMIYRIYSNKMQ